MRHHPVRLGLSKATLSALLATLVSLATACTEPQVGKRDGGREVPDCDSEPTASACDKASQDNVLFSWAQNVCTLMLDCCQSNERSRVAEQLLTTEGFALISLKEPALLEDPTACRRAVVLSLFSKYRNNFEAADEGRQRFDIDEARTCLSWLEKGAQACAPGLVLFDDAHRPKSCAHLFAGEVKAGERCFNDDDCIDAVDGGRSICESRSAVFFDGGLRAAVDGRCRAVPALGDSCPLPQSECAEGAYCAFDQVCRAKGGPGAPCANQGCNEITFCDTARTPAVCSIRRGPFGPCSSSSHCFSGLTCGTKLEQCMPVLDVNPLDVQFDFCVADGGTSIARTLPGVPSDGGL